MTMQYTYNDKGKPIGVFIPISEWKKLKKKYKDLDAEEDGADDVPPSKEEIFNDIREGLKQIKLHQEGKIKLKTAQQLLDEL